MNTEFINIQPLRYWVQRVLPLVYDDSLSYMELLNKVVYKLNELIENNKLLPDYIADLIKEYISSGAIEKVLAEILADYMLNVKFPPEGLTPATGDGSADDTEAIQGCINYAHEHGGMAVYFPSGSYLTQSLNIYDKTTMFGYDRYSTRLVLKGGATQPLLTGTCNELTLMGLGFDGNMDIQVNNINLIDITVKTAIITNCLLTDGYELLKINVSSDLQIDNIIFDHAVIRSLVILGTGIVEADKLLFKTLSSLLGSEYILLNTSNSIIEDTHFKGSSPVGIQINGSNNIVKFYKGLVTNPYIDNGINNTIEVYTESKIDKVSGNVTVGIGGSYSETVSLSKVENIKGDKELRAENYVVNINEDYTSSISKNMTNTIYGNKDTTVLGNSNTDIEGDFTCSADSITENIANQKTVKTNNLFFDTKEPLKYGELIKNSDNFSPFFDYIKFLDKDNNLYYSLVNNNKTKFLENPSIMDITHYGAIPNTDITDILQNVINLCPVHGTIYIPWLNNSYLLSNKIVINKPLTFLSNYYGYERYEINPLDELPLFKFTNQTYEGPIFDIQSYGTQIVGISLFSQSNNTIGFKFSYSQGSGPWPRFTFMKNCHVDGGNTAYDLNGAFKTLIINCLAYNCEYGFTSQGNTSLTLLNCWCRGLTGIGYNFYNLTYSSLINCACDSLTGYCGYFISGGYGVSIINCGCEVTSQHAIIIINTKGFNLSYHIQQNMQDATEGSPVFIDGYGNGVISGSSDSNNFSGSKNSVLINDNANVLILGSYLSTIKTKGSVYNYNGVFFNSLEPN